MTDRGSWIQTATGKRFYPLDPQPEDIHIEDIAAALSKLCRYGGHCRRFYSVAEHSWYVAKFAPDHLKMAALLHDASEAYLVDMPRPIKKYLPDYLTLEKKIEEAVSKRFNLPFPIHPEVKLLDNAALYSEIPQVLSEPESSVPIGDVEIEFEIEFWSPDRAYEKFFDAYRWFEAQ